ncbi:hypothetical protein ruthe_00407 [Rubellimicrobium thermophilum DSM 16684]|uniref:Ribosomal RNA large subunit methyltransferase H n=1 Tax=Rubellimicrobium thermophilum DSM 16684 TaxID=1123069 RepID=S9SMB5_9RHOB|nr:23S rRNA (pseudouridine(1915)-N(3))-methyltransferase RlmH [Rubellimicrobium thermophilum]EPX87544.1 hypothetical protein ruthe_00407 [Rubellimicrobium thermophilum DSM 16684]
MRVTILAVGRMRAGPEQSLTEDWLDRFARTGRALGLGPARIAEVEPPGGPAAEGAALLARLPRGAFAIALDERGETMTSPAFAGLLASLRDQGRPEAAFLIGGADGHGEALRARADRLLSFGPMVWPHMLARAMLAEQLYRAATILAGSPYHRG